MTSIVTAIADRLGLHQNIVWTLGVILAALVVGSALRLGRALVSHQEDAKYQQRLASLRTWWVLFLLLAAVVLAGRLFIVGLFAIVSLLALREFRRLVSARIAGSRGKCTFSRTAPRQPSTARVQRLSGRCFSNCTSTVTSSRGGIPSGKLNQTSRAPLPRSRCSRRKCAACAGVTIERFPLRKISTVHRSVGLGESVNADQCVLRSVDWTSCPLVELRATWRSSDRRTFTGGAASKRAAPSRMPRRTRNRRMAFTVATASG